MMFIIARLVEQIWGWTMNKDLISREAAIKAIYALHADGCEARKMRCLVLNCKENNDGYCKCPDYVGIDADGECDQMWIVEQGGEEDDKA